MNLKSKNRSWRIIIPYAIISGIIFVFNIISIWGFEGLLIDDQGYYFSHYYKSFSDLTFKRNILHALYTLGIIKIAVSTSVFFARFLIILLLSIPSAFLIYYLSHYHYKTEKHTAIAIAVLPFILPNELQVPTYLAGSYMLLAILFGLISISFILKYSKRSKFSSFYFVLAVIFYYLATESSELIASMLPVFLFPVFIFRKLSWKQFSLGILISLIAVRKSLLIINKPHSAINSVNNDLSAHEILTRIFHFPDIVNPFHGLANIVSLNVILIGIIVAGAIIVIRNHNRLKDILHAGLTPGIQKSNYYYFAYYYLFPAVWIAFSAIPFLFYSQSFTSRYFSLSAIGVSFMFFISISVITGLITSRKVPLIIILLLLISISGYNRQKNFKKSFSIQIAQYDKLKQTLKSVNFPADAQIIVTAPGDKWLSMGYGITNKSNGTLQYTLKRRDVKGQIMKEKCFYDPFQIFNKPWKNKNVDIDTTQNTYLFRCFNEDSSQNRRLYYALRWVDDKSKTSPWSIFYVDQKGEVTNFISGTGYKKYELTVDSLSIKGIMRNDIIFGGIPDSKDSLRLGL